MSTLISFLISHFYNGIKKAQTSCPIIAESINILSGLKILPDNTLENFLPILPNQAKDFYLPLVEESSDYQAAEELNREGMSSHQDNILIPSPHIFSHR